MRGPTDHRKATSWVTAKEHVHFMIVSSLAAPMFASSNLGFNALYSLVREIIAHISLKSVEQRSVG